MAAHDGMASYSREDNLLPHSSIKPSLRGHAKNKYRVFHRGSATGGGTNFCENNGLQVPRLNYFEI